MQNYYSEREPAETGAGSGSTASPLDSMRGKDKYFLIESMRTFMNQVISSLPDPYSTEIWQPWKQLDAMISGPNFNAKACFDFSNSLTFAQKLSKYNEAQNLNKGNQQSDINSLKPVREARVNEVSEFNNSEAYSKSYNTTNQFALKPPVSSQNRVTSMEPKKIAMKKPTQTLGGGITTTAKIQLDSTEQRKRIKTILTTSKPSTTVTAAGCSNQVQFKNKGSTSTNSPVVDEFASIKDDDDDDDDDDDNSAFQGREKSATIGANLNRKCQDIFNKNPPFQKEPDISKNTAAIQDECPSTAGNRPNSLNQNSQSNDSLLIEQLRKPQVLPKLNQILTKSSLPFSKEASPRTSIGALSTTILTESDLNPTSEEIIKLRSLTKERINQFKSDQQVLRIISQRSTGNLKSIDWTSSQNNSEHHHKNENHMTLKLMKSDSTGDTDSNLSMNESIQQSGIRPFLKVDASIKVNKSNKPSKMLLKDISVFSKQETSSFKQKYQQQQHQQLYQRHPTNQQQQQQQQQQQHSHQQLSHLPGAYASFQQPQFSTRSRNNSWVNATLSSNTKLAKPSLH